MQIAPSSSEELTCATLHLNKDFYNEHALRTASEDFSENFTIRIDSLPNLFSVYLTPKNEMARKGMGTIGPEFANYALSLMQVE